MKKLTNKQVEQVYEAAEAIFLNQVVHSCSALEHRSIGAELVFLYCEFYDQPYGRVWPDLGGCDVLDLTKREQRIFLLLLFAECRGIL